jgi:hypothetical protein
LHVTLTANRWLSSAVGVASLEKKIMDASSPQPGAELGPWSVAMPAASPLLVSRYVVMLQRALVGKCDSGS